MPSVMLCNALKSLRCFEAWDTGTPHCKHLNMLFRIQDRMLELDMTEVSERGHSWNVNTAKGIRTLQPPWFCQYFFFLIIVIFHWYVLLWLLRTVISSGPIFVHHLPLRSRLFMSLGPARIKEQQILSQLWYSCSVFHHWLDCMVAVADVCLFGWKAWKTRMEMQNKTWNKMNDKKKH